MPDWKRYVREHLPPLALDAERELEIVEELAQHLESIHEAALAEGVPAREAERRVAAQVADWRLLECEVSRAERGIIQTASRWAQPDERTRGGITMRSFLQDLRYGARMLARSPGFTLIAVFSLALGIGASTAIFSLADRLLLRLLPVKNPAQLVVMTAESVNPRFLNTIFSYPDYADYRDRNQVLSGLVAYAQIDGKLGIGEQTERVRLEMVSGNYFDVLGVRPALGRTFLPEEYKTPGTHPVVVLSHGFWRQRFGGDLGVLGKTVTLNNASYTVIGVVQPGFEGTRIERTTEIWTPVMMRQQVFGGSAISVFERKSAWLRLMGRLKPGVSLEQARTSLDLLARQIWEANTPQSDRNLPFNEKRVLLEPGGKGLSTLRNELGKPLKMLMAVAMLVLLIACANVATLLLARSTARRKEIAVRLALGASRFRIVRQLLTESILLVMISAAAGMALAVWLYRLLLTYQRYVIPSQTSFRDSLDLRVLGFAVLASVLAGLVFGLAPALQGSRPDLVPALKEANPSLDRREGRWSLRHLLVVLQIAVAMVVLAGAGLTIRSLNNLFAINPGVNIENVLVVPVELPRAKYQNGGNQFFGPLTERLRALPGVAAVSTSIITPLSGSSGSNTIAIEGYQAQSPGNQPANLTAAYNKVGPGYHEMMGIRVLSGRGFTENDREGATAVVVINEAMARRYFPNQNPVGKRMSMGPGMPWMEIIGVAADVKSRELTKEVAPHFDQPALQRAYGNFADVLVRTRSDAAAIAPAVRREVAAVEPGATIANVRTLAEDFRDSISTARMATMLMSLFGAIALSLAALGLYGVMAYSVTRRTHEIGIRMALGAQAGDVQRLILGQGMKLTFLGMTIGLIAAFALTRLIQSLLYGVSATDPATFIAIAMLLAIVALLANWIPARRATKVDPMVALRQE